jgi:polysaccharide deacetylase 2 family uncharacterized protein YibQ
MNKRKSKHKLKKISARLTNKKFINISIKVFLVVFLVAIASYFILKNKDSIKDIPNEIKTTNEASNPKEQNSPTEYSVKNPNEEQKYEEYSKELDKVFTDKAETEDFINKENELIQKKVEEIKENNKNKSTKETSPAQNKKEKVNDKNIITSKDTFTYDKKNKPKIAIVVDDVSTQAQKEKILSMGYKINMAFLPPTSGHPDSARIAQNLPFHMIHFPMQASPSFKGAEVHTLNVGDSYETIENRVRQLREWFPNAIYTNNHTGSAFTENEEAMDNLFRALKKYHFIFVDSRTSNKSVAKKYAQKYGMPFIVRNTFIDNEENYKYIQNQLKQAIDIAKKQGYSVAIGHPHAVTLQVLKDSKELLKDVEPIFINQLPYL